MAKLIEYDVEGVEESGGGTGVSVAPGLRVCRIARATVRDKKKDGTPANDIEVALDFGPQYDWLFTYIGLNKESDWKLAEFVRALGLKEKGKLNPDKIVGTVLRCKVNPGEYGGAPRPEAGKLFKAQPGDEVGSGASELSNGSGPAAAAEAAGDNAEVDADGDPLVKAWREGQPDPDNPDEVVGSYDDWTDDDLQAECSDRDLTVPGGRGSKRDKLIAALRADDEAALATDDEPEAEPEEPEDEPVAAAAATDGADEYDEWSLDQLKTEWADREFGDLPVIRGSNAEGRLVKAIVEKLREDDAANPFN